MVSNSHKRLNPELGWVSIAHLVAYGTLLANPSAGDALLPGNSPQEAGHERICVVEKISRQNGYPVHFSEQDVFELHRKVVKFNVNDLFVLSLTFQMYNSYIFMIAL